MSNATQTQLQKVQTDLIAELDKRISDKIIETTNADLLKKLINQAETVNEAIMIAELGTTYKRTGFHFDKRLEKMTDTIKFFKKNQKLSFTQNSNSLTHQLIIGDNYDALLNLLIEYRGKIDVIYIDPPYGKDSMGEFAQTNYDNAITRDNLLSMMYPRLVLARQLLSDNGVIFCSIDDKNHAYLKGLFDEVFGESSFVIDLIRKTKSTTNDAKTGINIQHENCLVYSKNKSLVNLLGGKKDSSNYKNPDNDPNGDWVSADPSAKSGSEANYFEIKNPYTGKIDLPPTGRYWLFSKNTIQNHIDTGVICFKEEHKENERGFIYKRYKDRLKTDQKTLDSLVFTDNLFMNQKATKELLDLRLAEYFTYPKGIDFVLKIIEHASNENSIILDFFAGSGTTGQAVLELNKQDGGKRQFILATANEITNTTPNGIVNDVTSKRLKRVMTGECYDSTKDFKWNQKNEPLGGNLDVYDISTVANFEATEGKTPFDVIDETLYGQEKLGVNEKIQWVCENFEGTQRKLESE